VVTFIGAFIGGVIPMLAIMGVVAERWIHTTYGALGTILHRTMMLDLRVARLLLQEFEVSPFISFFKPLRSCSPAEVAWAHAL
jgi:hypothetical protein